METDGYAPILSNMDTSRLSSTPHLLLHQLAAAAARPRLDRGDDARCARGAPFGSALKWGMRSSSLHFSRFKDDRC